MYLILPTGVLNRSLLAPWPTTVAGVGIGVILGGRRSGPPLLWSGRTDTLTL